MPQIAAGTTVSIHYIGTLDNGRIFDSTQDDSPLAFTIGAGEVFPLLERAVAGMQPGEVRNVLVPAADAFGPRLQDNVISLHRSQLPPGKDLQVGQKLSIEFGGNSRRVMAVTAVAENSVTLDGNHPLAGQDLTFAVKLDSVISPGSATKS